MSRLLMALFAAALLWFVPGRASAAESELARPRRVEIQALMAFGGPLFLAVGPNYDEFTTRPAALMVAGRLRHSAFFAGLEVNVVLPYGLGATALLDVYRGERFRFHVLDPGVFLGFAHPLSVGRANRTYDVTFGAGGEAYLLRDRRMSITFDWRAYLPDPYGILTQFGGYARPIYKEALQGGYVWIGVGYFF